MYLFGVCVFIWDVCRGQRVAGWSQGSHHVGVPGIEHDSSGLPVSTFTARAVFAHPFCCSYGNSMERIDT